MRARVLFHSDGGGGAEQIRRLVGLAEALARLRPDAGIVVVAGSMLGAGGDLPENVDWIKLPAMAMREVLVDEVIERFSPDLLIVDGTAASGPLLASLLCLRGAPNGRQVWRCVGERATSDVLGLAENYVYNGELWIGDLGNEAAVERAAGILSLALPVAVSPRL